MNNSKITKYTKFILWGTVVTSSLNAIFNLLFANLITTYFESETISEDTYIYLYNLLDSGFSFMSLFYAFFIFASMILLSKWFYTSCKLNHLSGVKGLETSPRWAWLWYAIPIANLVKPFQSLEETYKASFQRDDWEEITYPWVFPIWWGSFLVGGVFSNISVRMYWDLTEDSPYQDFVAEHYYALTSDILYIISAFALLQIVKTISDNQSKLNFEINFTKVN